MKFILKKGEMLVRDIVFIMLIMSAVLIFASTFVNELAGNYGNTEMTDEYALTSLAMDVDSGMLQGLRNSSEDINKALNNDGDKSSGLWTLVTGGLDIVVTVIQSFLMAPYTLGELIGDIMINMGATESSASAIKWVIFLGLWIILIFSIIVAFLKGAKI